MNARDRFFVSPEVNVVNDIPTEAAFFPARWGEWVLETAARGAARPPSEEAPQRRHDHLASVSASLGEGYGV